MKKLLIAGVTLLTCTAFAQNIYNTDGTLTANRTMTMSGYNLTFNPSTASSQFFVNGTSGNVGLGTITPAVKLDVVGVVKAKSLLATNAATSFSSVLDWYKNVNVLGGGYEMADPSVSGATRRMINFYDNCAYGSIPANNEFFTFNIVDRQNRERMLFTAFEAGGSSSGSGYFVLNDKNAAEIFKVIDDGNNATNLQMGKTNSRVTIGGYSNYAPGLAHKLVVQGGSALIEGNILTNGSVGIGTSVFTDGADTFKLSVNGDIRAKRVKVYTTWADYVFEKNYHLPTLAEVEQHIKDKGHLKDIPSAKEVEANGIEVGEMNKLLLQKVEELTLYVLQLNKELEAVKGQLKKE